MQSLKKIVEWVQSHLKFSKFTYLYTSYIAKKPDGIWPQFGKNKTSASLEKASPIS